MTLVDSSSIHTIKLEDKQLRYVVYVLRQRRNGLRHIIFKEPLKSDEDMEMVEHELSITNNALNAILKNKLAKKYCNDLDLLYGYN